LIRLLDKEELTARDYAKSLVFHECYGGVPTTTKENKAAIVEFFDNTSGSIEYESPFQVNRDAKKVLLRRFAPSLNLDTLLTKLRALPEVDKVYSSKGLSYVIQIKKNVNFNDFDKFLVKLKKLTTTRQKYSIYVTERTVDEVNSDKYKVQFHNLTVPQLLMKWLKFRVKLEKDSLTYQIGVQEKDIAYTKLLIFACEPANLDVIFKALRQADPATYISKHLKITLEQANQILDLKVRQLSKLDQDVLKEKLKKQQDWLKSLQTKLKKPSLEVKRFFEECLKQFECNETRKQGMEQFWLKRAVV
jgi:DNA gyrase/topoisomerase IV subunit A